MGWALNPQYSYGWAVPFLSLYLLINRVKTKPPTGPDIPRRFSYALIVIIGTLHLGTRLVQEANPDWRLVGWLLSIEVVSLTLIGVYLAGGRAWLKHFTFPICFFLVAVPWPSGIEKAVIQDLTAANVAAVISLLNLFGVAAVQHGNVIQISQGLVGIDEACSGIRSLQASIMISLFLGEFYRLSPARRFLYCVAAFFFAAGFNLVRTYWLVMLAAKNGLESITKWHDPAGVTILLACFVCLGFLGLAFRKKGSPKSPVPDAAAASFTSSGNGPMIPNSLSIALLAWLLLAEFGKEMWYRRHEQRLAVNQGWSLNLPTNNPTFRIRNFTDTERVLLRYDVGSNARWQDVDGSVWQLFYLRWFPGKIAVYLARSHTPQACLPAAGFNLISVTDLKLLHVHGIDFPFRTYQTEAGGIPLYVFYCLWEERGSQQSNEAMELTWRNRLQPVLEGRRNRGQRVLEFALSSPLPVVVPEQMLQKQLERLISPSPDQ